MHLPAQFFRDVTPVRFLHSAAARTQRKDATSRIDATTPMVNSRHFRIYSPEICFE